jgi:alkylhydroperoxidase family enzyme
MERIRPLDRDEAREDVRRYFDAEVETFGMVLNPTRVFAHSPEILRGAKTLGGAVNRANRIPAALKSLLSVRVATIVGCPF